ncbi:MAG: hypothetical protein ACLU7D_02420 [Collinsella sp.]
MFEKSVEELTELGAQITTAEIAQQPELWRDTLNILFMRTTRPSRPSLAEARAMGEGRPPVVFTGCRYLRTTAGDTCAPNSASRAGDTELQRLQAHRHHRHRARLPRDFPSAGGAHCSSSPFARSGNSL